MSAFIQMRSKPPVTTFSSKALSFYSGDYNQNVMMGGTSQEAILIESPDRVNFATHDQNLTTNRET